MSVLTALSLFGAILLLAITPGPGVFTTMSMAISRGFSHAVWVVLGIVTGDLVYLFLAILGLHQLTTVLGELLIVVRYLGAAYLIYLGYQLWKAPLTTADNAVANNGSGWSKLLLGLFVTLGNPKVILFYASFLPLFVDIDSLTSVDILMVCVIISIALGGTLLIYAYVSSKTRILNLNFRILNRVAASVLMITGVLVVAKS